MSFDGSFVCESALQRFLARCPDLQSNPKLIALSQKGEALTADDVVATIADPFLHPRYTIPIMGCFRPLCRRISGRAVAKLRLVPSLKSESEEASEEIGDEDVHVIDFYVRRGRGLRLHELASLAFCRALDLAPFLLGYILSYFRFSPPPFGRLLLVGAASQFIKKDVNHFLCAIRVSYRLLLMEPKVFSELWDWSCFLDLVEKTASLDLGDATTFLNDILDIRWCGIQILSTVLRTSDRANKSFGLHMDEAFLCLLRWEEFCQDTSLEKVGWYIQSTELVNGSCPDGIVDFSHCLESFDNGSPVISSLNTKEIPSERKNCRNKVSCDMLTRIPFILTPTLKKSFEMVTMAVSQKWPTLLHGPAGVGKTTLINYLAHITGNQVLSIHMDEQMDSKTLIGTYICTEQPGEFRWQPGSLTQAILNGLWVVFEDIDKAPNEVQSIVLPLLEGSSSFATGHGEAINVAESFRLFATVATLKHGTCHALEGRFSFSVLWRKVMVGTPRMGDMLNIVNSWYPSLQTFSTKLTDTFDRVNSLVSCQLGGLQVGGIASMGVFTRFSLRDLLKWCKRVSGLGFNLSGLGLSALDCQNIYQEAVDIFAASSSSFDNRLLIMRELAKMWGVPPPEAENLYPPNRPVIQNLRSELRVGRVTLQCTQAFHNNRPFVHIRSALHVLEKVACSVKFNEPVLLVGETGTGKTTLVQNLAMRLGQPLTVMNLSQQSDVADLLGGFKPTDARFICMHLYRECRALFCKTFSYKENEVWLHRYDTYEAKKDWKKLLHASQRSVDFFKKNIGKVRELSSGSKRKRPLSEEVIHDWESFSLRLDTARKQIDSSGMLFTFVEGAFITALKKGHWILLDEVNLAPPETLHRIIGVLDGENGTICLSERGDMNYVDRHPSFRLFACMNPATDAGKRDLAYSFKSRFSEYFVDDVMDDEDLTLFVNQYMGENIIGDIASRIVKFYKAAKRASEERLQDGANQKPQFSLRSLARALEYTKKAEKRFRFQKALYDGFCMFFLSLLDGPSAKVMKDMISVYLFDKCMPPDVPFDAYLERSKLRDVSNSDAFIENYVLTRSVKEHLKSLSRAVFIKRYPVLLQGPTSSGKTSLVQYLACITGHEFVRINNHEHTDLQEYFGSYITDSLGRLQFQYGVLVKAVREGHWIVLDELNLAPSDVLEALNRLLDDNRELFIPESQETFSAHPNFMLFATQNPPTQYGGRKMLSRAFRNRFLEIHVDDIPDNELTMILEKRCRIPASYATKMVEIMKDLQLHRQNSKVFAGKHGFITPRDLFRWANRFRTFGKSYEDLAKDGYLLLAERLREENEKIVVQEILERRLRVKLKIEDLYKEESGLGGVPKSSTLQNIIWTKSMKRLYFLVERCYKLREPVLLVGETGGGKTSVCQLLGDDLETKLHSLNCHQYTETSDFLGGFRPVRDRSKLSTDFRNCIESLKLSKFFIHCSGDVVLSSDISQAPSTLNQLNEVENSYKEDVALHQHVTQQDFDAFKQMKLELLELQRKCQTIFLWQDGPLVQAMKDGHLFLVDEISLADDSVLERLNSVLEPERKLSLAEKGGSVLEKISAHPNFFILATMNPGGDYGKKELSPALRNRFTEIWVSPICDIDELRSIAMESFKPGLLCFADYMLEFWQWFNQLQTGRILTVRDLLSWISFINVTEDRLGRESAYIHGAFLVLLDGLSLGTAISKADTKKLRESSLYFLLDQLKVADRGFVESSLSRMEFYGWGDGVKLADILSCDDAYSKHLFGIHPFYISQGQNDCKQEGFEFLAPTTCKNALRVLRAMQLPKPVLLEGSPGVGKTSLVVALAKYSGHTVVRINLSEQTDMMDLLGSDLPFEGGNGIEFCWSDGILLQALKNGSWVLLDELNLAPQSVLEGLNSILDHRAEVSIQELGQTFKCPDSFRVFACQNPSSQGGGRKGLPKSFLNRFTKVYVDELTAEDYLSICQSRYPSIPIDLLLKLISFNSRLYEDTMIFHKYGQEGSPWEFNLRDVIRSCQIIEGAPANAKVDSFLSTVYLQRMRTAADRKEVLKLYEAVFGLKPFITQYPQHHINPQYLVVGSAYEGRNYFQPIKFLKSQLNLLPGIFLSLEAAVQCVQLRWLCILVGPYSSGKTSLIRLLAQLTGNELNEINLSSGTDVSELLGCFEQYNSYRSYKTVISQVERYVGEYFSLPVELAWKDLIGERKSLFSKWSAFLATKNYNSSMSTFSYVESWRNESCSSLSPLIEIIEQLQHDHEKYHLPVSWSYKDLAKSLNTVLELQKSRKIHPSPKFEWVTSNLIKAIECGEWVVLDNANLCNPTVLDRINSLVEPEGSITINECGLVDGKPLILHAHPKFRMFLTVDPKHGEVSRAMRNRGVEVYMMQPNWLPNVEGYRVCEDSMVPFAMDAKHIIFSRAMLNRGAETIITKPNGLHNGVARHILDDSEVNDVTRLLTLSGIPVGKLVMTMSDAHLYAEAAGLHRGVRITLLELNRWVQLFQLLLMNGNQPAWSLQVSWEHTYLSSLGEVEGSDTIMQAKLMYLSDPELFKLDPLSGCSLSLPGGWPLPHTLRNFVLYSKEACVKRNCVYLEFLGAQCASYELKVRSNGSFPLNKCTEILPTMIPRNILHHLLFPNALDLPNVKSNEIPEFDLALVNQMLFIAANWTIEQATESDFDLYIQWFKWYNSQLRPYCSFFESFLTILEHERDHPIWSCNLDLHKEVCDKYKIDIDVRPIPLLSSNFFQTDGSDGSMRKDQERLDNAIHCVSLLHLTYQQWNAEKDCAYTVLDSLRCLEREVLNVIMESREHMEIYSNLLEHHILFWKSITPLHFDYMSIAWSCLKKDAIKLLPKFPEAVRDLLEQNLTLNNAPARYFNKGKSTLWVHGGHPILPSSVDVYHKVQQLLALCYAMWPRINLMKQTYDTRVNAVLAANSDLRHLAMQGICMSSYITTKGDQEYSDIMHQMEEIHQRLLKRFEYERRNLEMEFEFKTESNAPSLRSSTTTCCAFSPEILLRQSGFASWVATLPLFDKKSLSLDIKILQELLGSTLVDDTEVYQVESCSSASDSLLMSIIPPRPLFTLRTVYIQDIPLESSYMIIAPTFVCDLDIAPEFKKVISNTSDLLQHGLDYSLNFSSRSPVDFSPHQTILWILDAWNSVDSVCVKIASYVLEMWFKWQSSLWSFCSGTLGMKKFSRTGYEVPLTRTATLDQILHISFSIEDYDVHCLKLRVASQNIWQEAPFGLLGDLRSAAHSLFKQIIFVHKKSFEKNVFKEVKSLLCQLTERGMKPGQLQKLRTYISTTSDHVLSSSMDSITSVIEAFLKEQDLKCALNDSLHNLGCAWLYIGVLRYDLLLNPDGPDPSLKYAFKHSQIQEKICLLKLEVKVRKDCEYLAGRNSTRGDEEHRLSTLQKLEMEQKRIKKKVVFRPEPSKYKNLRSACADFREFVPSCMELLKNLECNKDLPEIIDKACNWQVTSASFIDRLSEEYPEYIDIIQPIQVAVYEMKLGLSIALSSALEREYLKKVQGENMGKISAAIYSLMQFPRSLACRANPINIKNVVPKLIESESIHGVDVNLLEKLITVSSDMHLDKAASLTIHHTNLIHVAHHVCSSRLLDKDSFLILDETFRHFTDLWLDIKTKAKDDGESQFYKFRPRSIKIEDIFEEDLCSLNELGSAGSLTSTCEENLVEQEFTPMKQHAKIGRNVDEERDLIPEYMMKSIVHVHNQLFGSSDLVKHPGVCHISDEERLRSFMNSYKLGARILNGDLFFWLPFSTLDDSLVPEHLLHLCLEYEQNFALPQRSHVRNIYKDSNASNMFEMVKPLTSIQERVRSLLDEWPDHPGLQKILDLLDMLLAIPPTTPLSKPLLGLQILVSKAQFLKENTPKFSLEDRLPPIYELLSLWQKWGIDCWPALLDEVQEQYEISAGELWFLLLPVLHRTCYGEEQITPTIESVEEFIRSSSIGEFKKRLHLLLAFHGQLSHGICLKSYSSHMRENLNVLYNVFGYYVQFLPLVLEHIASGRRRIEKDLEKCQKLFKWDHHQNYLSIETFRRTRQKMWKHIQEFNDILQQPFMGILNQEASLKIEKVPAWLEQKISDEMNMEGLQFPLDLGQLCNTERFLWYDDWRNKANAALRIMFCDGTPGVSQVEGFATVIRESQSSESTCENFRTAWAEIWASLEKICRNAAEFAHIWKNVTKNLKKRRALGELLKILDRCGLSKHRSELDLESGQPNTLFLQPSYDVVHLLQHESSPSSIDAQKPAENNCSLKWVTANQYYFKNLAIMKQLLYVRSNFSKDLTLEQVNRATSFLHHLVSMQQDQRHILYGSSEKLKKLRQLLKGIGTRHNCSVTPYQHAVLDCMWQQKQLFDSLLSMSKDACLFLGSVKNSHLSTCEIVNAEADKILVVINKFDPIFTESKESLDKYLLGYDGAVTTPVACMPFVVSEQMEQSVMFNLETIEEFEKDINNLSVPNPYMISVKETLLGRLRELIVKGKKIMKDFDYQRKASKSNSDEDSFIIETMKLVMGVFEKLDKLRNGHAENITLWIDLFKSCIEDLHLDHICDVLSKTIVAAIKLVNGAANRKPEVERHLKQLYVLLDLLLTYGESVLSEFLDVHKTVAEMSHALAQIFSLLFSKGFGDTEDRIEDSACNGPQDASGTGMGEGEGMNDVSDQIEDEAQLLGTSEKQEGLDVSDKVPSEKDKGIEMDEDFTGDTFSVSEDSEDDDGEDEESMNLESKMEKNVDGTQVVDEKLWDKDEDGNPDSPIEKYESGPSVKETDTTCRELRAKDDNALTAEESAEMDNDESDRLNEEDKKSNIDEDTSDMKLDKDNAYDDPTELQLNEQEQNLDDVSTDEPQGSDILEETEPGPTGSDEEMRNEDEKSDLTDQDENHMQVDENTENKGGEDAENSNMDLETKEETFESDKIQSSEYPAQGADSFEPASYPDKVDSSMEPEIHWPNSSDVNNGFAPSRFLPTDEVPLTDLSMPESRSDSRLTSDQPKPHTSQVEASSFQRTRTNPYRSIGDALEEWKERVEVSVDPQEHQSQAPNDLDDENADEYRYVSETEKGTTQALGPAASDQTENNVEGNKSSADEEHIKKRDDVDRMDSVKENPETCPLKTCQASIPRPKVKEEFMDAVVGNGATVEEIQQSDLDSYSGDMISFKSSYMNEILPTSTLSGEELSKSLDIEEISDDMKQISISDWRRYELATTRLSQELAEQMRLVLEPTLASKLQGDYRTGKRINMKKIIPYIASKFRKDKIWLRRTRPNKRDYQVVIAIDDSRSMSESHCGNVAVEALVTVCRAMSQLEVGQFAVASFGEKGNIKLLHDFDQPFTGETGVNIISNLSFKQDNTIADEPMVDLLKYLNTMLDNAVAKARTSSGQNPLHQLILIIADGRFHEKENLKRCVRDVLSRKRMVAFILLDSPQESIMDLMEASFEGQALSFTKYLNSFPFPYYIILKNIEALPRTLADLLRQWFELMRSMSE